MEPLEWGLAAIAALMAKQALETTRETLTEETLGAILPPVKSAAVNLPQKLKTGVSALGSRIREGFPAEENPFDDPVLLAQLVEKEAQNPAISAVIQEVQAQLPPIKIRIDKSDRRKQQGIILEGSATATIENVNQNFS